MTIHSTILSWEIPWTGGLARSPLAGAQTGRHQPATSQPPSAALHRFPRIQALVTSYRKRKIQCQLLELNFKDFLYGERMRKLPLGISWNTKSYGAGEIHDWHTFYKVGGPGLHISRSKEKSYICSVFSCYGFWRCHIKTCV